MKIIKWNSAQTFLLKNKIKERGDREITDKMTQCSKNKLNVKVNFSSGSGQEQSEDLAPIAAALNSSTENNLQENTVPSDLKHISFDQNPMTILEPLGSNGKEIVLNTESLNKKLNELNKSVVKRKYKKCSKENKTNLQESISIKSDSVEPAKFVSSIDNCDSEIKNDCDKELRKVTRNKSIKLSEKKIPASKKENKLKTSSNKIVSKANKMLSLSAINTDAYNKSEDDFVSKKPMKLNETINKDMISTDNINLEMPRVKSGILSPQDNQGNVSKKRTYKRKQNSESESSKRRKTCIKKTENNRKINATSRKPPSKRNAKKCSVPTTNETISNNTSATAENVRECSQHQRTLINMNERSPSYTMNCLEKVSLNMANSNSNVSKHCEIEIGENNTKSSLCETLKCQISNQNNSPEILPPFSDGASLWKTQTITTKLKTPNLHPHNLKPYTFSEWRTKIDSPKDYAMHEKNIPILTISQNPHIDNNRLPFSQFSSNRRFSDKINYPSSNDIKSFSSVSSHSVSNKSSPTESVFKVPFYQAEKNSCKLSISNISIRDDPEKSKDTLQKMTNFVKSSKHEWEKRIEVNNQVRAPFTEINQNAYISSSSERPKPNFSQFNSSKQNISQQRLNSSGINFSNFDHSFQQKDHSHNLNSSFPSYFCTSYDKRPNNAVSHQQSSTPRTSNVSGRIIPASCSTPCCKGLNNTTSFQQFNTPRTGTVPTGITPLASCSTSRYKTSNNSISHQQCSTPCKINTHTGFTTPGVETGCGSIHSSMNCDNSSEVCQVIHHDGLQYEVVNAQILIPMYNPLMYLNRLPPQPILMTPKKARSRFNVVNDDYDHFDLDSLC